MWSNRCEPGTIRVAPLSGVKSVRAQMATHAMGTWGRGRGMEPSSQWNGCGSWPGPMEIAVSDDSSRPSSSTPSASESVGSNSGTRANERSRDNRLNSRRV